MLLSAFLAGSMVMSTQVAPIKAAAEAQLPYISEVFIAYGQTEDEAKNWLVNNGWEPVEGDFNAGKTSAVFSDVAAVMGIRRTADPNDAVTDMAVMNMNGGYSFDDYETIVNEKKAEIDEFIYSFIPALEEYRINYTGGGGEGGKKRAQYAHDLLNKFYDGEVEGEYAVHDTGMPLGDLLLEQTRTEYGEAAYDALSKNDQIRYGDLQQIILESSGPAVLAVEQALALATDTGHDSWLDRLQNLSGTKLTKNIGDYVPEAKGQKVSRSAALNYLNAHYGDAALTLSEQWDDIHQMMVWYEVYCTENNLWQDENETDEAYGARIDSYFEGLKAFDEKKYEEDLSDYLTGSMLFNSLYEISYKGEWGETLGDFFNPYEDISYNSAVDFLPFAAALSEGQRHALQFLPLATLLKLGVGGDAAANAEFESLDTFFGDKPSISIYSGINRAIFRDGVALTSEALMRKNEGQDPYADIWDEDGIVSITSYCGLAVGAISVGTGKIMAVAFQNFMAQYNPLKQKYFDTWMWYGEDRISRELSKQYSAMSHQESTMARIGTAGKWLMGIGAALMLACAALKAVQIAKYYQREFTVIPVMIVDEADIVTYKTDENGNAILNEKGEQLREINFDQFAYYQVVKCNRQEIGIHSNAMDGVDAYAEWGCGDAADLNCDIGRQWLALYTVKNPAKGNPINADSLKLQYGSNVMPEGCTNNLHFFCYTYAADLGDEAFAFNNDMEGIYFFWSNDENAFTASTFSKGYIALAAIGGLIAGILGTTAVMLPKKNKQTPDAPAATA